EARIVIDEPARVVVTASTESPAWLVLTDTWFPGWRARLDGADIAVSRADHAFRAVALPPGRHEGEFVFTPRGLRLRAATALTALAIVGVVLLPRRRSVLVLVAGVLVLAPPTAHAALPTPPFTLTAAPSSVDAGDAVSIDVVPRATEGGPWDVYVVWLYAERAAFLGPDGAWTPRRGPFRRRRARGGAGPPP